MRVSRFSGGFLSHFWIQKLRQAKQHSVRRGSSVLSNIPPRLAGFLPTQLMLTLSSPVAEMCGGCGGAQLVLRMSHSQTC